MTDQHTPGPWAWNEAGRLYHSIPEHFASVNILVVHDPVWRPREADARLLAAAPDLLEALSRYVSCCGNTAAVVDRESVQEAYRLAQAAIDKALSK